MQIFSDKSGRVMRLDHSGLPATISVEGWKDQVRFRACITRIGIQAQVNCQFMHTLRNFVYVYVFGDRIGNISIGGVTFGRVCELDQESTGLEALLRFFMHNKVSTIGRPVHISIGANLGFDGWLTDFRGGIDDAQADLGRFDLEFRFLPKD